MLKTIVILILALIVVPLVSYKFDQPLTELQLHVLCNCIYIALITAFLSFTVSEITGNCSQVDKIWSIIPIVYVWYIAYEGGMSPRLILMAALVTAWGVRLTYNFSRRGAYTWKFWSGEEDYRWGVLRQKPELKGRMKWFFFNLFFISLYQNGLILLFTLPILMVYVSPNLALGNFDILFGFLFVAFLVVETIADQQQWNYQTEKHKRISNGMAPEGIYIKGFTHTGLWKFIRHPNYMAEQAIWVCFYLLGASASGHWINWSVTGCLLLMLLFQGSADFSEAISESKYPQYIEYKRVTGRFLPKF